MEGAFNRFPKSSSPAEREEPEPAAGSVPPEAVLPVAEELKRRVAEIEPAPSDLSPEEVEDLKDTLRNIGL